MSSRNYVVSEWVDGESFHTWRELTEQDVKDLERITGAEFAHILPDYPIEIKLVTDKELRQSVIDGALYDGHSLENATRLADGKEALSEYDNE